MKKYDELQNDVTYISYQSKIDRVKELLDDDESNLTNLDIIISLIEYDRKILDGILKLRKEQKDNGSEEGRSQEI